MIIAEMWLDEVAKTLGKPVEEIRELNLYNEGDLTHYKQEMSSSQVPALLPLIHIFKLNACTEVGAYDSACTMHAQLRLQALKFVCGNSDSCMRV